MYEACFEGQQAKPTPAPPNSNDNIKEAKFTLLWSKRRDENTVGAGRVQMIRWFSNQAVLTTKKRSGWSCTTPSTMGLSDGFGSVAQVIEGLARAYLNDGKLSVAEIEEVFHQAEDSLPEESK